MTPAPSSAGALERGVLALVALALLLLALVWAWWRAVMSARPAGTRGRVDPSRGRRGRARAHVVARLSPSHHLGLHLTLGLLVSAGALAAFAKVVDDLLERDDLALLDARVAAWFAAVRTPLGLKIFYAITQAATPVSIMVVAVVVAVLLLVRRQYLLLVGLTASLGGGTLLDWGLKMLFHRPRPAGAMAYLHRYSWSFPSGHVTGVVIGYGFFAYLLVIHVRARWQRALILLTATLFMAAVMVSRLYLGVHYLTDVAGALAAGTMWLAACVSGIEALRRQSDVVAAVTVTPRGA